MDKVVWIPLMLISVGGLGIGGYFLFKSKEEQKETSSNDAIVEPVKKPITHEESSASRIQAFKKKQEDARKIEEAKAKAKEEYMKGKAIVSTIEINPDSDDKFTFELGSPRPKKGEFKKGDKVSLHNMGWISKGDKIRVVHGVWIDGGGYIGALYFRYSDYDPDSIRGNKGRTTQYAGKGIIIKQ